MTEPMSVEDQKWQAESDARTLAEAKIVNDDPSRLAAATAMAEKLALERAKEAKAMNDIAKQFYPRMAK
jgi:hypothetical protein